MRDLRGKMTMGAFVAVLLGCWLSSAAAAQKYVILMIADGSGFNSWSAASMYEGKWDAAKQQSTQVYDGQGWVKLACCTYPLNTSKTPSRTGKQEADLVYNPTKAWDPQQGYAWLRSTYTDSAAAATALSTGRKTFNHAINWNDLDQPITPTMCEAAKAAGKAVGVITTVPWSHATPAGLSNAHSINRDDYVSIATQMLAHDVMDVIMGAGNPDFNNNGAPVKLKPRKSKSQGPVEQNGKAKAKGIYDDESQERSEKEYKYVGGEETWKAIEAARLKSGATHQGFRPVSTKAEFEALLSGKPPAKVLGTAQVATTLQQCRQGTYSDDPAKDAPFNRNVPDLATMTKGAINVLHSQGKGFFLMIEGGAVDWANHKNQPGRMIQEQVDFNAAVQAVVDWVEANSNWQETLLVLTADHETGLLWGQQSKEKPFDPIVDRGPGKAPDLHFNAKNHSNSLVPLRARGAGSELFTKLTAGKDPVRGAYVDNTTVAKVLMHAAADSPLDVKPADGKAPEKKRAIPGKGRAKRRAAAAP